MADRSPDEVAASVQKALRQPLCKRRARAADEAALLACTYYDAACALNFRDAFELLVATVLSAQTTDARVNQVTPELFDRWPDPQTMAEASVEDLEQVLRPLGMYHRRADALIALSNQLTEEMGGAVPDTREQLVRLKGVGRKTAHVVLGNWFGGQEITVDTHVERVTRRLAWADAKTPLAIEKQLWELLPDAQWTQLCHELIFHGRQVCHARRPDCMDCVLIESCPSRWPGTPTQETPEESG